MFQRERNMESNKPVHTVSCGTLRVSIWKNTSELGDFFNLGIHRVYLRNGQWERSSYFSEYDLLTLSKAVLDAHSWIQNHKKPEVLALSMPKVTYDDDETPTAEN